MTEEGFGLLYTEIGAGAGARQGNARHGQFLMAAVLSAGGTVGERRGLVPDAHIGVFGNH